MLKSLKSWFKLTRCRWFHKHRYVYVLPEGPIFSGIQCWYGCKKCNLWILVDSTEVKADVCLNENN